MRVASIVLVILCETAVAESVPDRETQQLATGAQQLARQGRCGLALELGDEVAKRDAGFYQATVAADAGLFACVNAVETERRYQSWRDRQPPRPITQRIGVDAMQSLGLWTTRSAWLRYEHSMGLVARVGGGQAFAIDGPKHDALAAHVGIRSYIGRFYLYAEAGAVAVHKHAYDRSSDEREPARWSGLPSFAAGLGGKLGRVDLGLSVLFPALGLGVNLGFDFLQL